MAAAAPWVASTWRARGAGIPWRAVCAILLLGLALRVGLVLDTHGYVLFGDAWDYDRHARSLADTGHFPTTVEAPGGGPTAFRPPLYPLLLAPVYALAGAHHALEAARLFQAVLGVAVVVLIGVVCRLVWDRRTALIAMVIAAIYPPLISVGGALLSETLFVLLELGACAAVLRARTSVHRDRWAAAAGILCGLAALTRTIGLLLVIPIVLATVERSRGWRRCAVSALAVVVAAALTVAPWTIRNAVVMKSFVPVSTEGGPTLAGAYNGTIAHFHFADRVWAPPWSLPDFANLYWRPGFQQAALAAYMPPGKVPRAWRTDLSEPALAGKLQSAAVSYITAHPLYAVKKTIFNAATLFQLRGPYQSRLSPEELAFGDVTVLRVVAYSFYVVLALALLGAATRRARAAPRFLWLIPPLMLTATVIDSLTRLRAPIDVFLIMLAAVALAAVRRPRRLPGRRGSLHTPAPRDAP